MAKTNRTIITENNQEFGQFGDPNKLETQITHAFDKIDENDTEFQTFKNAAELPTPSQSVTTDKLRDLNVTEPKLADDSVSRRTIQTGAVGKDELDPTLWEQTASKVKFDEIDAQLAETVKKVIVTNFNTLQDAVSYAVSIKAPNLAPILYFPYSEVFETSSTLTVPAGIGVEMDGVLIYTGSANEPALVIGENGIDNNNLLLKLNVKRQTDADWSSELSIGVKLINCNTSEIHVKEIAGFTIGLQTMASGKGFSYNNVFLGRLVSNKYGLDLTTENSGWCNENSFYGGRFSGITGVGVGLSRYGVRITSKDGTYTNNNNNNFYKPSFELQSSQASPNEAIPILLEHGKNNKFVDCRNENNSNTFARILNNSSENEFHVGYGTAIIEDNSNYPFSKVSNRGASLTRSDTVIFNSKALHKNACYYNGNQYVNIPNVHIGASGGFISKWDSGITLNDKYLEIAGKGVGVYVDTTNNKRFVVKKDVESGYGGRVVVRCFDASGNTLDNTGLGHPYVKGASYASPSYTTSWGKAYITGVDSSNDYYFVVGSDVKSIQVTLVSGTNPLRIRSFSIVALDNGSPTVWLGYEEIVPGVNLGTTPPTAGTWGKGRRVFNDNPSVGQPKGWICTVAGTPGTWVSEGNL